MKKGISLIVVIVTVAIMLTLISVVTITGNNVNNNAKKVRFASEVSYLKELLDSYKSINSEYPVLEKVEFSTKGINSVVRLNQFKDEQIIDEKISLYKIDYSKLGMIQLTLADKTYSDDNDSVYLLSKDTGKVYYKKGYKIGNDVYYTLGDSLKKFIDYSDNNNINDGIIFVNYSNTLDNKVNIDIKIPDEYTDISITSNDNGFVLEDEKTDSGYKIYKTTSSANSQIIIKYKVKNKEKNLKYDVNIVDKSAPTFTFSNITTMEDKDNNIKERFVKLENIKDNLTGIKQIKYSSNIIDIDNAKEYFSNSGNNVDNNIINISNNMSVISVYAEDNAGNYTVKYLDLLGITDSYTTDKIILHYDGMKNTRNGNNLNTSVWEDLSGNNTDLSLQNFNQNPWKVYGLVFDGENDFLNDITLNNMSNLTFQFVLKYRPTDKYMNIFEKATDENPMLWIDKSSKLEFCKEYNLGNIIKDYSDRYIAVTVTVDKEKSNMYVNLEKIAHDFGGVSDLNGRYQLFNRNSAQTFNGEVLSIRAYNKVLTQEEIKHNYEIDKNRFNIK